MAPTLSLPSAGRFVALAALCVCTAQTDALAQGGSGARYATAKSGAKIRNYADRQGLVVRELNEGEMVRLFGDPVGVGFLEAETPGGMPVWVFGEYMQETDVPGVLRVTGSGVNMRPQPMVSVSNMPLGTKLQRGDRVELIERQNASLPLKEDWVRVWSPARARGWILASDTVPVADQSQAVASWQKGLRSLPTKPAVKPGPATVAPGGSKPSGSKPAQATPKVSAQAAAALKEADALFSTVTAGAQVGSAQYEPVLAAYRRVIEIAPAGSTTADLAQRRLEETRAHAGIAELKEEVAMSEARMRGRLDELSREQARADLEATAHWGRFNGRGRVESEVRAGERRFYLRWAGQRETEITCTSGRYDLQFFEGVEIGIMGHTLRQALPSTAAHAAELKLLDLYRVEVISAGSRSARMMR